MYIKENVNMVYKSMIVVYPFAVRLGMQQNKCFFLFNMVSDGVCGEALGHAHHALKKSLY